MSRANSFNMLEIEVAQAEQETGQVVDGQLHPTRPWVLLALSSGAASIHSTRSGEVLHSFKVDTIKCGPLRSAQFFDASCLQYISLLPPALIAEARTNAIVALCAKAIVVYDCVTKLTVIHAPASLATGLAGSKSSNGVLSGAFVGVSCEHIVVGTTHGSLFTVSIHSGNVAAFSGTSKIHEKSVTAMVALTGRPSPQLHRARIVSGCQGGVVAVWEVICETPIYKSGPRVLTQSVASPVENLRYDSSKNRLICYFGNGSVTVWGFEEQSQEEVVLVSVSKGFFSSEVAIPRASWDVPDESLLTLTAQGRIALVLPLASAAKVAKSLQKGVVSGAFAESRSTSSMTSDGIVCIRHIVDFKGKVVRFWQHPLSPHVLLCLCSEPSPSRFSVYLCNQVEISSSSVSSRGSLQGTKLYEVLEGRLVVRTGSRFQAEKTLCTLSPFTSPDVVPDIITEFSGEKIPDELIKSLDLDKPVEALWPGGISTTFRPESESGDSLLIGICYKQAKRVVIIRCAPQSTTVVHSCEGEAMAFATSPDQPNLVLVSRHATITTKGPTSIVESSRAPSLRSQLTSSLRSSSKSFRSKTNLGAVKEKSFKEETSTTVQHYYLSAHVLGVESQVVSEVQLSQPITDIFCEGDVLLIRCEPPYQHNLLKAWGRWYSLSSFIREKKLVQCGPMIPSYQLVSVWRQRSKSTIALVMNATPDRIILFERFDDNRLRSRGAIFTRSSTRVLSMTWHHGSLMFVNEDEISIAFIGNSKNDDYAVYTLAARGRHAQTGMVSPKQRKDSLHVHDDSSRPEDSAFAPAPALVRAWEDLDLDDSMTTSPFPVPVARPTVTIIDLVGVEKETSELVAIGTLGKIHLIPLKHPLIRLGMLASSGLANEAIKWSYVLPPLKEARDEALVMLERLGFSVEASRILGVDVILLLDLCVRHKLQERAAQLFDPRGVLFKELCEQNSKTNDLAPVERLALLLASGKKVNELVFIASKLKSLKQRKFCLALANASKTS